MDLKTIASFFLLLVLLTSFPSSLKAQDDTPELRSYYDQDQMLEHLLRVKKLVFRNQDSALVYLVEVQPLLNQYDDEVHAVFYNTYGLYYWFTRDYEASIRFLRQTIKLNPSEKIIDYRAEAANNTGTLFSQLGQQDSAIYYLNLSLEIDRLRNNEKGMAKTYYDLGLAYNRLNHLELALRNMLKSTDLNEKVNAEPKRLFANYNVLGNLYSSLNDTSAAHKSFMKGMSIARMLNDSGSISMIYGNISVMFSKHGNAQKALDYAFESQKWFPQEGDPETKGVVFCNIAGAYFGLNDYESTLRNFRMVKPYISEMKISYKAEMYIQMSDMYLVMNMIDSALYANNFGISIARGIQTPSILADGFFVRSRIDSARREYKSALEYYKRAQSIKDSILDNEHRSRVAEMRIIYDIDKKESENEALKNQNLLKEKMIKSQQLALFIAFGLLVFLVLFLYFLHRSRQKIALQQNIILRKNEELNQLNQTKDKFISIIAHDLRSPFNSLLGLLQDLVNHYDSYTDEEKLYLLKSTYNSSINTYNLLVNLLDWTMAQRNGFENKPLSVNVHLIVNQVFEFLKGRADQKNHELVNETDPAFQVMVDPNILSNILINLINNAIKFTPEGGNIHVETTKFDEHVQICVRDNGIGIPEEKLSTLFELDSDFKRNGTADELGTGLGLVMVKEFLQMSKGKIHVESVEGKGSSFCIELPNGSVSAGA
ncbi:MAG: Two-component system-sensor histidine kinase [Bacteroidetes bacterium]|nr:MAG: Two-component system-sensor histidine kinase [Bacteroidota bacterium]